jgi:hypothetical protein
VTLSDDASEDAAAIKKELATLYGARLDISASSDVPQFTVTMMPARARLLSADPRVNGVAEVPLTAESPAAPASVSSARRFTPNRPAMAMTVKAGRTPTTERATSRPSARTHTRMTPRSVWHDGQAA